MVFVRVAVAESVLAFSPLIRAVPSARKPMAAPGHSPISVTLEGASHSGAVATNALLGAMLHATSQVSDLVFSPGRPPQVGVHGQLIPVQATGLKSLTSDDTRRIA